MRKWGFLYVMGIGCLLFFLGVFSERPAIFPATNNNLPAATFSQFQPAGKITSNNPAEPVDAVLQNDAMRSFRVFEQERNNCTALAYSFFQLNGFGGNDEHAYNKTCNNLATGYLDHIYPSHNFW